jgi:hypothetical protein
MRRLALLLALLVLGAALCSSLAVAGTATAAPTATTTSATDLEQTRARVRGNITESSAGAPVQYYFDYGTTTAYAGRTSTEFDYGADSGNVSRIVEGLSPGTVYHYRVVALKDGNTVLGNDMTFTTSAPPASPDTDGDGYPDNQDSCPNQPGGPAGPGYGQGCPPPTDSDGDGYADNQDACPGQPGGPGGPGYGQGCPAPPDSDGDGYPDSQDACPGQPGGAGGLGYGQGCPVPPDSDGDGYRDSEDPCPAQAGTGGNGARPGCPDPGPDRDGDGVPDAQDECPDTGGGASTGGCGVFRALIVSSDGRDLSKLAKDPVFNQAQCYASRGETCSFHAKLTLDAASAKKLKLRNRTIGDVRIAKTTKEQKAYDLRYVNFRWDFSKAEERALAKASSVKLTMSGTYTRGSDAPKAFTPVTWKAVDGYDRGSPQVGIDTRVRGDDGE